MNHLSNREIASLFWLAALAVGAVVWVIRSRDVRTSVGAVVRAFLAWKIQFVLAVYFAYATAVVSVAATLGLWHFGLLKDTLIIVITLGLPLVFSAPEVKSGAGLTKRLLLEVAGLSALLVFYLNLQSLALWAELLVQPLVAFILMLAAVANLKSDTRRLTGPLQLTAGIIGLLLLVNTTVQLVQGWRSLDSKATIETFVLGIALPILLLPLIYVIAFSTRLETILTLLPFHNSKNRPPLRVRFAVVLGLHFSARYAARLNGRWLSEVARATSFRQARGFMRDYRASVRSEAASERTRVTRLKEYAGISGIDEAGLTLDRREFAATKDTLDFLWSMQLGWYRNRLGHFKSDMLDVLGNTSKRGLPADSGIELVVSGDKQSWRAHRRTPSGLVFGVGGATNPRDEKSLLSAWRYAGSDVPKTFPAVGREGWHNSTFGDDAPDWLHLDRQ
jgi:hypothetical protein